MSVQNANTEEREGEMGIGDLDSSTEENGEATVSGVSEGGKSESSRIRS